VKYRVRMVEVATGRDAEWDGYPWSGNSEGLQFYWTEGNFGCDCNRRMDFVRQVEGREPEDEPDECPCGHGGYRVPYLTLEDGTRLEIDGLE